MKKTGGVRVTEMTTRGVTVIEMTTLGDRENEMTPLWLKRKGGLR